VYFLVAKIWIVDLVSARLPAQSLEGALARAIHLDRVISVPEGCPCSADLYT
jgi:hypothetical protein